MTRHATLLHVGTRLRVIAVLAVAVALCAVVGAPALIKLTGGAQNSAEAATIKTRSVSCSANAFFPGESTTDYSMSGYNERVRTSAGGDGIFWCNAALPNKATVTKVVFDVIDSSATLRVLECGLRSIPISGSGGWSDMAMTDKTGALETPGRVLLTDTTIQGNPTNNATTSYSLYCNLDNGGGGADVGFFGASITYTITVGNG